MSKENLGTRVRAAIQDMKLVDKAKAGAGKAMDGVEAVANYRRQVDKTIKDIPAIAKTEALTLGPRVLDAVNNYVYKPVVSNTRGLLTGDGTKRENALDRVANNAREHRKDFYKNHNFNQSANRQHGEMLGNQLVGGVTLGLGSRAQLPTRIQAALNARKVKPIVTPIPQSLQTSIVPYTRPGVSDRIRNALRYRSPTTTTTTVDKGPSVLSSLKDRYSKMGKFKKWALGLGLSTAALVTIGNKLQNEYPDIELEALTDEELEALTRLYIEQGRLPSEDGNTEGQTQGRNNATSGMEKNVQNTRSTTSTGPSSAPVSQTASGGMNRTGMVLHDSNANRVPLYRNGDRLQIKGPDGKVYTLATGITDDNMQAEIRKIAHNELPF